MLELSGLQALLTGSLFLTVAKAPEAYQTVTADQVKTAFAKYYVPESHITVAIKSDGTGEAPKEPAVRRGGQGATPGQK